MDTEVASLTCAENFALSVAKNKEQKSMDTEAASLTYAGKVCITNCEKSKEQKYGHGGGKLNMRRKIFIISAVTGPQHHNNVCGLFC